MQTVTDPHWVEASLAYVSYENYDVLRHTDIDVE